MAKLIRSAALPCDTDLLIYGGVNNFGYRPWSNIFFNKIVQ